MRDAIYTRFIKSCKHVWFHSNVHIKVITYESCTKYLGVSVGSFFSISTILLKGLLLMDASCVVFNYICHANSTLLTNVLF